MLHRRARKAFATGHPSTHPSLVGAPAACRMPRGPLRQPRRRSLVRTRPLPDAEGCRGRADAPLRDHRAAGPVGEHDQRGGPRGGTGGDPPLDRRQPASLLDPFCGGGSIPLEAQRLGLTPTPRTSTRRPFSSRRRSIEIPPKFANLPPVSPGRPPRGGATGAWKGAAGLSRGRPPLRRLDARRGGAPDRPPVPEGPLPTAARRRSSPGCGPGRSPVPTRLAATMPLAHSFWLGNSGAPTSPGRSSPNRSASSPTWAGS